MKTSSHKAPQIEKYLLQQMNSEERLLFEAQMVLHPDLAENTQWQQHTYHLVHQYGRQQLRAELEEVYQTLFTQPRHQNFRQKILRLFSK
uniref:Uncharacterized protein n=1 Tax=Roseihalotalea indica TaxID=2867963 RepID=A0AA49GPL9_9BACT|nr:hypothetical protein K4G66_05365 [Tunicatimonas sp. TK19036]